MRSHLETLARWIAESDGTPISLLSGKKRAFRRLRAIPGSRINKFEASVGRPLPATYRELLKKVGAAELFASSTGFIEIYDPDLIGSQFADYFEESEETMHRLIPVACDTRLQELIIWVPDRDEESNVIVVAHDTPPEDWEEEADAEGLWTTLDAWIQEMISTDGELAPH